MRAAPFAKLCLCLCLGFSLCPSAHAANFLYSSTVSLTDGLSLRYQNRTVYPTIASPIFTLAVGDTISGTVTFANNERLQISNTVRSSNSGVGLEFFSPTSAYPAYNSTVTLLGVQGNLTPANPSSFSYPGSGSANSMDAVTLPGVFTQSLVSFSGFTYSATITGFVAPSASSMPTTGYSFTPSSVLFFGPIDDVAVVAPEPPAYALLFCSLFVFGFVFHKQRPRPSLVSIA